MEEAIPAHHSTLALTLLVPILKRKAFRHDEMLLLAGFFSVMWRAMLLPFLFFLQVLADRGATLASFPLAVRSPYFNSYLYGAAGLAFQNEWPHFWTLHNVFLDFSLSGSLRSVGLRVEWSCSHRRKVLSLMGLQGSFEPRARGSCGATETYQSANYRHSKCHKHHGRTNAYNGQLSQPHRSTQRVFSLLCD